MRRAHPHWPIHHTKHTPGGDAAEHEVLIAQRYLPDDDLEFIKSIEPFLRDPRYIRVDGAPLLTVYRP